MKNQSSYFAGKPDPSFLPIEKALSSLSYECAAAIRCFYHCGLHDTSMCQHFMEIQSFIDAAMNDITLFNDNAKSLDKLGDFYFQGKNTDVRFRLDVRKFFQLINSDR